METCPAVALTFRNIKPDADLKQSVEGCLAKGIVALPDLMSASIVVSLDPVRPAQERCGCRIIAVARGWCLRIERRAPDARSAVEQVVTALQPHLPEAPQAPELYLFGVACR